MRRFLNNRLSNYNNVGDKVDDFCEDCENRWLPFSRVWWDSTEKNIANIKRKDNGIFVIKKILSLINSISESIKDIYDRINAIEPPILSEKLIELENDYLEVGVTADDKQEDLNIAIYENYISLKNTKVDKPLIESTSDSLKIVALDNQGESVFIKSSEVGKVKSVNNKIGDVILKTSDLENDSDYTTNVILNLHTEDKNNPHNVTKEQVGLGNVDNTSDLNKPISTATQTELNKKLDKPTTNDTPDYVLLADGSTAPKSEFGKVDKVMGVEPDADKNVDISGIETNWTNENHRWSNLPNKSADATYDKVMVLDDGGNAGVKDLDFVPYTGATANVNLGARSITSTGGFIGNASTATKLVTARTINGTSFNGSANITTANWGTARNIKIGDTTKSVNGSGNYSWSLAEIGASSVSHTHPISDIVGLQTELNKIGNLPNLTTTNKNNLVDAINEVNGKANALDAIGTTNLLPETKTLKTRYSKTAVLYRGFNIASGTIPTGSNHYDVYRDYTIDIPDETEYVVSFYAKASTNLTIGCFFYSPNTTTYSESSTGHTSTAQDGSSNVNITTSWKKYWVKWKQTVPTAVKTVIVGRMTTVGATVDIAGVKLERGSVPTDWSPNPNDVVTNWNETDSNALSFIKNKPTIPTVNNGQLTLSTGTGLSGSATFTANQSGGSTFTVGVASTHVLPTTAQTTSWNNKQDAITGGATTITSSNLTANRALISNASGKVAVSPTTSTELGYLSGVTSSIQIQLNSKINSSLIGANNGVASLDSNGKVLTTQLPSYVDDVIEESNLVALNALPSSEKQSGKIYVALDTNKTYRWSGSAFIHITSGAVDSVAGKTGVVTLVKGDVGLGNVDNTSDLNKPISTATQTELNKKLDKPTTNNTNQFVILGDGSTAPKSDFGKVDKVMGVEPDADKNVDFSGVAMNWTNANQRFSGLVDKSADATYNKVMILDSDGKAGMKNIDYTIPYIGANKSIDLNTQKITHNGIVSNVNSITSHWLTQGTSLTSNNKVAYLIIDGFTENTNRQLYIEVESISGNGELKRLVKGFYVNFVRDNFISSVGDSRYLEVTGSEGTLRYGIGEVEKHSDAALKIPLIWLISTAQSINKISVKSYAGLVSNLTFRIEYDATSTLTTENPYLYRNASEKWVNSQINNGKLTLSTGTGLSGSGAFTSNQSGSSTFSVAVANTHKLPTTTEWGDILKKDEPTNWTNASQQWSNLPDKSADATYDKVMVLDADGKAGTKDVGDLGKVKTVNGQEPNENGDIPLDLNYVPLTGTEVGKPLTGSIEISSELSEPLFTRKLQSDNLTYEDSLSINNGLNYSNTFTRSGIQSYKNIAVGVQSGTDFVSGFGHVIANTDTFFFGNINIVNGLCNMSFSEGVRSLIDTDNLRPSDDSMFTQRSYVKSLIRNFNQPTNWESPYQRFSGLPNRSQDATYNKKLVLDNNGYAGLADDIRIPPPPETGNYRLESVNGVISWVLN